MNDFDANQPPTFGTGDSTYRAAGGTEGVRALVDSFYDRMGSTPKYKTIWDMHPDDREMSRDKLARFLCAWMGGPRLYKEKYGAISIPGVHAHLPITEHEKSLWLDCMHDALIEQKHDPALIDYLLPQLAIPASRIVSACTPTSSE